MIANPEANSGGRLGIFTLLFIVLGLTLGFIAAGSVFNAINPLYSDIVATGQLVLLGVAIALLAVIGHRFHKQVLKPIAHLHQWSQRIRAGDLATPIPAPGYSSLQDTIEDINNLSRELGSLTDEFDVKVRAQTEHIGAKSRSLEILYDIATDLSTARNLDELLEQFLDTLMVLVDARAASVRLLTEDNNTRLVASRGFAPDVIKHEQVIDVNRCLCGRIAQYGGFGIQKGVAECEKVLGCAILKEDCSELIVVPLQYRDRILGVYNLFLDRPSAELGRDARDLLNSIGKHLGLAVEKSRLDNNERLLAVMEERNIIGNELHDSLAQSLVSMRLQVKMLGEILHKKDIRSAQNEVRRLNAAVEEAHHSLRELLSNFRSRMDERGLVPAVEDLVRQFKEETGVAVFLQKESLQFTFTPFQEVQIFRIIQEALANIRKHSNACNVRILLQSSNNSHFNVLIEDDGLGIIETPSSTRPGENIGLSIMRERATRLNGKLTIESEPGEGTRVRLSCPINLSLSATSEPLGNPDNARTTH